MRPRREFIISKTVQAQFRNIDRTNALAILRKLDRFERTGIGDVKKLVDIYPPELRLRHRDFRVRFFYSDRHRNYLRHRPQEELPLILGET